MVKDLPASAGDVRDMDSIPGKFSQRREWHLTPVFLPGKLQGQRILAGYSPWGLNELETTERLSTHTHTHTHTHKALKCLKVPVQYVHLKCIKEYTASEN